ncbi:MAG: small, acid-soluble spore protein, H family [Syntrophomonadaceae bacterium]|nr:small, acid-soluble spore protein, H family [Syntrophomonadaceae bacterium]
MDLERLTEIMESSDPPALVHNTAAIRVESVSGSSARIRYLNSNQEAVVPISELVEVDLPDLEDQYPTGWISRQSPVIRA